MTNEELVRRLQDLAASLRGTRFSQSPEITDYVLREAAIRLSAGREDAQKILDEPPATS